MHSGQVFNARALAKALDVSQVAISKSLPLLEKKQLIILDKNKESKRFSIELNKDNILVLGLKRADNLKLLYESKLPEFLKEKFPGCTITLFGSYSRGEDVNINNEKSHNSDIDIAIIGIKEKFIDLERFERCLEKKIILNFYDSFKDIHKNLKENILNGILLSGGIELWTFLKNLNII